MKQKRPTEHTLGGPLTKAERVMLANKDNLQHWIDRTIILAFRLKAKEIHYIRAKDGLTVQFRKGVRVLRVEGPYKRYQDRVITRIQMMGRSGLPKRHKGQTGGFRGGVDDRAVNTPIFYSRTKSGERMVVRFTSSKPYAGQWAAPNRKTPVTR